MTEKMENRDYNKETLNTSTHQYAYHFDFDVMHPLILRTLAPYFKTQGNVLEIGCYQGRFTERLFQKFEKVTCVEASDEAILVAKERNPLANYVSGVAEEVVLNETFKHIFLTHVLEHFEKPEKVLSRIKKEWLAEDGLLFVVCPNALAGSRQIAVHMGLIESPESVTSDEQAHGHFWTFTRNKMVNLIEENGFKCVEQGGIFFKALANFQIDKALGVGVIDEKYCEGAYQLGRQYPDLCSSIYGVFKKKES